MQNKEQSDKDRKITKDDLKSERKNFTPEYYEDKKSFLKTYNELYSDKFPLQ